MEYECAKAFSLGICDDDGFEKENKYMNVVEGSTWESTEDSYKLANGDIRLENDDNEWIEISEETLEECFKTIN